MKILDYSQFTKYEKVCGIVTPIDWDRNGKPCKYSLYTLDEEDIIIEAEHLKKKIKRLANKYVEVTGNIYTNVLGDRVIYARKIKRLSTTPQSGNNALDVWGSAIIEGLPLRIPDFALKDNSSSIDESRLGLAV